MDLKKKNIKQTVICIAQSNSKIHIYEEAEV